MPATSAKTNKSALQPSPALLQSSGVALAAGSFVTACKIPTACLCLAVLVWVAVALSPAGPRPAAAQQPQRPNVLVILADDLGYGDVGYQQVARDIRTPHIDRLAREGMVLQNFYANCPVCSPTRASLLTGCYPDRVGVPGVIRTHAENNWGYLSPRAVLLPEVLRRAGYRTGIVGKWHLGLREPNLPHLRGFEHVRAFLGDMMDDYWTHRRHGINYMHDGKRFIDPKGHATDVFTRWAVEFIRRQAQADAKRPFFLYLAYNAPHVPIQPPPEWLDRVRKRHPELPLRRAKLVALIEHMDHGIGQVLAALDETGLAKNTLVIFTSDNGGQLSAGANNGPWRDGKQSMYEGGLRVPAVVRWPGVVAPGSRCAQVLLTMDIFPTVVEAAGGECPPGIDGRSFLPYLKGAKEVPWPERSLYFVRREGGLRYGGKTIEALRLGPWKLVINSPFGPPELFHLQRDPQEKHDLRSKAPGQYRRLAAMLRRHIQRGGQVPWQRPEPEEEK